MIRRFTLLFVFLFCFVAAASLPSIDTKGDIKIVLEGKVVTSSVEKVKAEKNMVALGGGVYKDHVGDYVKLPNDKYFYFRVAGENKATVKTPEMGVPYGFFAKLTGKPDKKIDLKDKVLGDILKTLLTDKDSVVVLTFEGVAKTSGTIWVDEPIKGEAIFDKKIHDKYFKKIEFETSKIKGVGLIASNASSAPKFFYHNPLAKEQPPYELHFHAVLFNKKAPDKEMSIHMFPDETKFEKGTLKVYFVK